MACKVKTAMLSLHYESHLPKLAALEAPLLGSPALRGIAEAQDRCALFDKFTTL